jgi:hypothetical protein
MFFGIQRDLAIRSLIPERGGVPQCPQCRQANAVRAVRAILAEASATPAAGAPHLSGRLEINPGTRAALAARLQPPPRPVYRGLFYSTDAGPPADQWPTVHQHALAWELLALGISGLLLLLGTQMAIAGRLADVLPLDSGVAVWLLVRTVLASLIVLGIGIHDRRQAAQVQAKLVEWQRAFARWQALHYCARCDGVFVPQRASFARAHHIWEYLYRGDETFQLEPPGHLRQDDEWSN